MTKSLLGKRLLSFVATFLLAVTAFAQITVKGVVKDEAGEPIIGANVLVKGTTNGTITDFDGNYAIEGVGRNATLVFSYVGYNNLEIAVNGQTTINASMKEDSQALDEVMVVGYAVGSKRTVSGAVDRVKKEDMNKGVVLGATDALKGKVAGVTITNASGGDPMGATNIAIRGTSSLSGGNDPLVIIDGVFGDMRMMQALSSNDIETMTILKDASETAQYGSRGAAGVIVITTTKGKAGVAKIDYSGSFGVGKTFKKLEMLSADQYLGLGGTDNGFKNDWYDLSTRSQTLTQNHNVAFTTGNENGNMRASIGVVQNQGLLKNSDMNNYTFKMDATQFAFKKALKIEMGLMASERDGKQQWDQQRMWNSVFACAPTYSKDPNPVNGEYEENDSGVNAFNPIGMLQTDNTYDVTTLNAHGKATWTILPGLNLSAFGSWTSIKIANNTYIPNNIQQGIGSNGRAYIRNTNRTDIMGNIQLTYTKDFGKHHIDALGLMEGQKYTTFRSEMQASSFETNYFGYNNMQAGSIVKYGYNTSNKQEYLLSSYMARLNYMFNDRYIATVNVRTDGSSKLGANHKWGLFPSASVAWIISNEGFLKGNTNVNNLKVRAGYGVTGNQDAIAPYNSLQVMTPSGSTNYNGSYVTTFGISSNPNPDLQWETKKTFDVGIDGQFFGGRLNATIDYYIANTTKLLYTYTVPVPPFTYDRLLANMGEMTNKGLEIAVGGDIVKTKDFTFSANYNMAIQSNKLKSLHGTYNGQELSTAKYIEVAGVYGSSGLSDGRGVTYLIEGQPVGTFFVPHFTGFSENGNYILEDLNGDGGIDTSTEGGDRQIAGQAIPKVTAGLNLGFKYKNWDLSAQFNGAFGHKIMNGTDMTYSNMDMFPTYNVLASAPTAGNGKGIYGIIVSDYWLEKGDYVQFEYVTLGYNFNMSKVKAIQNLRLALSCNNVCTFTGYSGLTPLINSTSLSSGSLGVDDKNVYPLQRTFSVQLNVTF